MGIELHECQGCRGVQHFGISHRNVIAAAGLGGGRVSIHSQRRPWRGRPAAGELQLGSRLHGSQYFQVFASAIWLLQAWVEDEFQFIAKGDHGVADLQLESSSWGVGRPAGANRSLLKSIPGMAAPTSRLAVAFLHDPCTVSLAVDPML